MISINLITLNSFESTKSANHKIVWLLNLDADITFAGQQMFMLIIEFRIEETLELT